MSGQDDSVPRESVVPVLRVRDADAAVAWYRRLGFQRQWVHRFRPDFPAYVSVARPGSGAELHLSEHAGDARPDTLVFMNVTDLDPILAEFGLGAEIGPWGGRSLELRDPDGNRIRLGEPAPEGTDRPEGYDTTPGA